MTVAEVKAAEIERLVWELHDEGKLSWSQAIEILDVLKREALTGDAE